LGNDFKKTNSKPEKNPKTEKEEEKSNQQEKPKIQKDFSKNNDLKEIPEEELKKILGAINYK
jgi:hypothetical protein